MPPRTLTRLHIWLHDSLHTLSTEPLMTPAPIQPSAFGTPSSGAARALPTCCREPNVTLPSCCHISSFMVRAWRLTPSPFSTQGLPGSERPRHTARLGRGHVLQPATAQACFFCLHSFISLSVRALSGLHERSPSIQKLTEEQRMATLHQNLIRINGTLIPQKLFT